MRRALFVAALLLIPVAPLAAAPDNLAAAITKALADPARPAADRQADAYRKPAETLRFSGVKPGMIVGEFYPGGGYFTRLLSDVVGPAGHVYGLDNKGWGNAKPLSVALSAEGHYGNVSADEAVFGAVSFPRSLDIAWITQNYHDMKIAKFGVVDTLAFDRKVFAALKPGGTFFILDHDARPGLDEAGIAKLHRIPKAQVIREVTAAGFKLVDEGNFLRNPADDHMLPIFDEKVKGHTDQYALRFVKPRK